MKKFVFSLEKVLDYQRQMLDVKKNEMTLLQLGLKTLEEKIRALESRSAELERELAIRLQTGMATRDAADCKNFQNELARKREDLLKEMEKQQKLIAAKRQEIVRMNGDISGLERLKDKQWKEYQKSCGKEQELAIEEFVGRARCSAG